MFQAWEGKVTERERQRPLSTQMLKSQVETGRWRSRSVTFAPYRFELRRGKPSCP
jgi:hypothetical protein